MWTWLWYANIKAKMLNNLLENGIASPYFSLETFTCQSPFPFWRVHQILTFWTERWCKAWVQASVASSVWGCCKRDLSRPVSCSCSVPRRHTPHLGWCWAAAVGSAAPSVGWSELWRASSCAGPRPSDGPRWERRSCGSRSPTGRSPGLFCSESAGRSWWPGRRSHSASSEAAGCEERPKMTVAMHIYS